ncbi:aspartyl/asparaginyl beta-hydroxylase domain-containing protein [archaeon]|nr:MAG: aspartyl/asparaginyl beta-hydroxylase domain-containing protein [archaeon]
MSEAAALRTPNFFDWHELYPFLEAIQAATDTIFAELKCASRWFDWPETELYHPELGANWKVFPFCHTIPSNDPSAQVWLPAATSCPATSALLRAIPGLRTALFSRMGPQTVLEPHTGWADVSNHVLRCHLPLYVPEDAPDTCGIQVEDELRFHKKGQLLVFDDSKIHFAFNAHKSKPRYVLIFDIERPAHIHAGTATGSTTEELKGFIDYFK